MCIQISYELPCEHIRTMISYCGNGGPHKSCKSVRLDRMPYPPPPGVDIRDIPACPLPNCPYEVRNRCWNCCWCGKSRNMGGRCDCIMISDGNEYRCDHICCHNCEAGYR
ncbi:hypothetical protein BROUX41_003240 [Berkeleyomyces rouxiae]|uniref:uncharacterized protein n=1 Tax=Berkeleyomyces rouxiae TaxID=2035830 RepID=UPI003B81C1C7